MGQDDETKDTKKAPQEAELVSPDEVQEDDLKAVSGGAQMTPLSLQPTKSSNLTIQPTGVTIQPTGVTIQPTDIGLKE